MLELLILSLMGLGVGAMLMDIFNDDDETEAETSDDTDTDDGDTDAETPDGEDGDSDDDVDDGDDIAALPDEGTLTENTTITLSQDDIDALITRVEDTGDVPSYFLDDNAVVTVEIDGEVEGYLHTLNYADHTVYTGYHEMDHHTLLVWTDSPDAPELQNTNYDYENEGVYLDGPPASLVGDTGTVLLDIRVYHDQDDYGSDAIHVEDAGRVEFDASQLETAAPEYPDYDADTSYIPIGDDFILYDDNEYNAQWGTTTNPLEVLPDGTNIDLNAAYADQLITETQDSDGSFVATFDVSNGANITVTLDPTIDGTVHKISYDSPGDGVSYVMLVRSDSAETPVFVADISGELYFKDQTIEPIIAFQVGEINSATPNGTVTLA